MQIILFNPDICTLLLRYRQRDDRLCGANVLLPDFSQPVIEALSLDAVLHAPLRDGQAACLLCFDKFRPFLQAYCLSDRCDLCYFILHNATSHVQRTPIYYMELLGVFWNVQFTPSSFLEFIIHHWTTGGKTRIILRLFTKQLKPPERRLLSSASNHPRKLIPERCESLTPADHSGAVSIA